MGYSSALRFLLAFPFFILVSGCEKDETKKANSKPDTKISLHTIDLKEENRLQSTVTLKWSGTDKDGFIKGFEISFDKKSWHFTQSQDSTFQFRLETNSKYEDIEFYVRAIDNQGQKDPSPAHLTVPIKNTPPKAEFNKNQMPSDTAFTVFPLSWNASDADGQSTIDSVFVKINEGAWYPLKANTRFTAIVPVSPNKPSGKSRGKVYKNFEPELLPKRIEGLRLNRINQYFIKVKDIAGATSETDTAEFYLKPKTSNLLVLGATSASPKPGKIYRPMIRDVYGNFDYINYFRNDQANLPQFWNSVFSLHIRLYDKLFLYTDDSKIEGELILEAASKGLQQFLNENGKLLISTKFPDNVRNNSNVFDYSPMDRFPNTKGQARIPPDSLLEPSSKATQNYDTLQSGDFVVGADPFYPKSSASTIYRAQLSKLNGWEGPRVVVAKTTTGSKVNQVFSSVNLHVMNKRKKNLKAFFEQVLTNAFNW